MPASFSNPQIIRFCNGTIRPLADEVVRLSVAVQSVISVVQAQNILATLQTADPLQVIDDGSSIDGRPQITVGQLVAFLNECQKAHEALDTTTAVQRALAIQVNGLN